MKLTNLQTEIRYEPLGNPSKKGGKFHGFPYVTTILDIFDADYQVYYLRHYVQEGTAVCPLGMAAWRALSAAPASAVSTQQPPLHHRHTAALLHDPASHLHYSHTLFYTCGWVGH